MDRAHELRLTVSPAHAFGNRKCVQGTVDNLRQQGKWRASESKLRMTISGTKARQKVIEDSIEKAKSLLGKNTTSFGALISRWPTTESKRLSNLLDTIKANVGFTELQSMRDASPTGGALGQVSEMENRLLQSVLGSLDQAGDSEDLRSVLDTILVQRQGTIDRLEAAYEMDKASYGSRAEEQKEVVKPEDGEGYSMEDLEYTAKQHGITVEEVKRRLGGK